MTSSRSSCVHFTVTSSRSACGHSIPSGTVRGEWDRPKSPVPVPVVGACRTLVDRPQDPRQLDFVQHVERQAPSTGLYHYWSLPLMVFTSTGLYHYYRVRRYVLCSRRVFCVALENTSLFTTLFAT